MIGFHAAYDLVNLFGLPIPWLTELPGYLWQQSICWTFILLSGFCWGLSRRPVRHGLLLVGCGALITLVTYVVMPSELIQYGVLTLLGLSALLLTALHALFSKLRWHIPAAVGLGLSLPLLLLTRHISIGSLGLDRPILYPLYQTNLLAVLGFHSSTFFSADYFPLLPWFFLYLAGHFLRRLLLPRPAVQEFLLGPKGQKGKALLAPAALLGRHSLLIYLLHQPVLLAVFSLPALLSGQ